MVEQLLLVQKMLLLEATYGELPTPSRSGYTFAGWWTAVDSGEQINAESVVKTASDHVLYAHWVLNSVSVSYQTHVANIGWQNGVVKWSYGGNRRQRTAA